MKTRNTRLFIPALFLIAAQLACNLSTAPAQDPAATLNALYTQSAQTLESMATSAAQTAVGNSLASPTPLPTNTLLPGFSTPTPIGPIKTITPTTRCNWLGFVSDVTYPDGTGIGRNTPFTKIWRIKNLGTCTWTTAYDLVFVSGEAMSAPAEIPLTASVAPGQTIDISANLISPNKDGEFTGYFKMRDASGLLFGAGAGATTAIWVDIKVSGTSFGAYDFVSNVCDAQWSNNNQNLSCPGAEGDSLGYVINVGTPKLEDGTQAAQTGIVTYPKDANNGFIRGVYPPITIQDGDRFRSIIQCRYNSAGCNVIFSLDYQIGGGPVKNLGHWNEAYEGLYYTLDIDLSSLKGQNVKFIFTASANGSANKDFAYWVGPRILRNGNPPPTSKTIILPLLVAESGSVTSAGAVDNINITVGDNAANEGVEAFLSFDLSGIPSNATIQSATLKLLGGGQVHGTPFASLGCLKAYLHYYGPLDAGDFVAPGAGNAFASWCDTASLSADYANASFVNMLQSIVGNGRLRFRLQFKDMLSDGNSTIDDILLSAPIVITVTYTTP